MEIRCDGGCVSRRERGRDKVVRVKGVFVGFGSHKDDFMFTQKKNKFDNNNNKHEECKGFE